LILSTDGLNADHMSAYGYERDTTPFLRTSLSEWLVAENHLSNSNATAASIAALLTGALPTETRVFNSPDVLVGEHAFRHLPGLLREWGYTNADLGFRFFADAHDMNMQQAFQIGTGRRLGGLGPLERVRPRLASEFYFLSQLQDRLGMRLGHAFGVKDSVDPLAWQNWNEEATTEDESRIAELRRFLEHSPRPFFAHVHLLATHGPRFYPTVRQFSAGTEQGSPWMTDFYDDAILQFDSYVAAVVEMLQQLGDFDDTLLVINSDHGSNWAIDRRLPLLIRFPGLEHRGRVTANTQRIDIAPTVVAYLAGHVPAWMAGQSLITADLDPHRLIFSFASADADSATADLPFYNLRAVQVAVSNRLYRLDLQTMDVDTSRLDGHTAPLQDGELPSIDEMRRIIVNHLMKSGFDVTSLKVS
jgi:arylsulfatase A-like enzyme